jgi:uncharacterized membrane protein YgdD (TMEM256/DUF423 family)
MDLRLLLAAALLGGSGVVLGAFAAHGLRDQLAGEALAAFEIGVRYQMYHALALLGVSVLVVRMPATTLPFVAGILFVVGTVIFSGSLYLFVLTGQRWFGAITPVGGLAFVGGWGLLVFVAVRALSVAQAVP